MQKAIGYFQVAATTQSYDSEDYKAKQQALIYWTTANDYELVDYYSDIVKDVRDDCRALRAALNDCKEQNATLILALSDQIIAMPPIPA